MPQHTTSTINPLDKKETHTRTNESEKKSFFACALNFPIGVFCNHIPKTTTGNNMCAGFKEDEFTPNN